MCWTAWLRNTRIAWNYGTNRAWVSWSLTSRQTLKLSSTRQDNLVSVFSYAQRNMHVMSGCYAITSLVYSSPFIHRSVNVIITAGQNYCSSSSRLFSRNAVCVMTTKRGMLAGTTEAEYLMPRLANHSILFGLPLAACFRETTE